MHSTTHPARSQPTHGWQCSSDGCSPPCEGPPCEEPPCVTLTECTLVTFHLRTTHRWYQSTCCQALLKQLMNKCGSVCSKRWRPPTPPPQRAFRQSCVSHLVVSAPQRVDGISPLAVCAPQRVDVPHHLPFLHFTSTLCSTAITTVSAVPLVSMAVTQGRVQHLPAPQSHPLTSKQHLSHTHSGNSTSAAAS